MGFPPWDKKIKKVIVDFLFHNFDKNVRLFVLQF